MVAQPNPASGNFGINTGGAGGFHITALASSSETVESINLRGKCGSRHAGRPMPTESATPDARVS